jgi:hypothetical protein
MSKDFIQQDNIRMIWELISEEEIYRFLSKEQQSKVHHLFLSNIRSFYESEMRQPTISLVEMNKKYMLLLLKFITTSLQVLPSKIRIHNTDDISSVVTKEAITYEEIKQDRKTKFERNLHQRQEELDGFMTVQPPPLPDFADKNNDEPIKEMDKIVKEMQAQRKYEVEQIRPSTNTNDVSKWLSSQETSSKAKPMTTTGSVMKTKKTVSFEEEQQEQEKKKEEQEDSFFSKLKKIPRISQEEDVEDNIITNSNRISFLEKEVYQIHSKLDLLLELLQK